MSKALERFKRVHEDTNSSPRMKGATMRLGQLFCMLYIKGSWPELFHESSDARAEAKIEKWLTDNQYTEELPKPI
jgi:hypothetical protein